MTSPSSRFNSLAEFFQHFLIHLRRVGKEMQRRDGNEFVMPVLQRQAVEGFERLSAMAHVDHRIGAEREGFDFALFRKAFRLRELRG